MTKKKPLVTKSCYKSPTHLICGLIITALPNPLGTQQGVFTAPILQPDRARSTRGFGEAFQQPGVQHPPPPAASQLQVKAWLKLRTRQLQSNVWGRRADKSGPEFSPITYWALGKPLELSKLHLPRLLNRENRDTHLADCPRGP